MLALNAEWVLAKQAICVMHVSDPYFEMFLRVMSDICSFSSERVERIGLRLLEQY